MTRRVLGSALLAGLLAGWVLTIAAPPAAAASTWSRCAGPVTWSLTGATAAEALEVDRAVVRLEIATGQRYELETDGRNVAEAISVIPSSSWTAPASWDGFTWWAGDSSVTGLRAGQVDMLSMAMHELMLSRHLVEAPDRGGLLGHVVPPGRDSYSAADNSMLAASVCLESPPDNLVAAPGSSSVTGAAIGALAALAAVSRP